MTAYAQETLDRTPRRRGVVGPLFLVGLGIVLLMNSLGVWELDVWAVLLRLWPLLLIAGGLDLLFGRQSVAAGAVVLVITVLMFAAGIWYISSDLFAGVTFDQQALSQSVSGAERANITLEGGVGTLRVSEATDREMLVTGEIELASAEEATERFEMDGDIAVYHLNTDTEGSVSVFPFGWGDNEKMWDIQLNGELPMDLNISTAVGEAILDLQGLEITDFTLNTGVGETTLTLPASGEYTAAIEAGVGEVTVRIPEDLAARVTVNTGLGAVDVQGDFERDGESTYVSPNWSSAENLVTLWIDAGIGTVNIIQP